MQLTKITPNLFQASDIFPAEIVKKIVDLDWANSAHNRMDSEKGIASRRHLIVDSELSKEINAYIRTTLIPQIEAECGIKFHAPESAFIKWWLDEPGFKADINHEYPISSAMQVYWNTDNSDLGSTFYSDASGTQLVKRFLSQANTGYVVLNSNSEEPLWHQMEQPVPEGTLRLTNFVIFGTYYRL